ncbi:dihydrofolate reductase family protein [Nocardioides daphniae]|uniref:Deaminase n=1 Tax=Nocardioides daphniae TaxID=402297 RepID=A0A4P7UEA4_9ACTN|nr:dihydrofolate reductase family protein [Nocardioides daphniae]QCC77735.1 dihydrofolate reductase [Nocardioides daphniae]GGD28941.1 deaminase [Nocardioides daphniae]
MHTVSYAMNPSVDGFVEGPDGDFQWGVPDDEVFAAHLDELRGTHVHLLGRKLYETMLYWQDHEDDPALSDAEREWAVLWNALPKVVFSTTLSEVRGNARLATRSLAEEVDQLRNEPGDGTVAIGGATLAAEVASLGLIDEYRLMIHPVLVGGGRPYFPRDEREVPLELVETRVFGSGVLHLTYRVRR